MRRLSLWMRAHPAVGDSVIALLLLLFDSFVFVVTVVFGEHPAEMPPAYVAFPVNVAMVLPLVLRRRHPIVMAYLILLLGFPHSILELGVSSLATGMIAVYTLVVYTARRQAAIFTTLLATVSSIQIVLQFPDRRLVTLITNLLLVGFSWVLGEFVAARRAYQRELEARLELAESERDHVAQMAVASERGRISRELHDVVAHSVSVIVVQADGASYALRDSPEQAEQAVRTISETGRTALAELRRLLDVLRNEDVTTEPRVPQPDAEALHELVERMRAAGLRVRLELGDDLDELPAGVSLGIYRIVQESLTNTLKHAGEGAVAEVVVRGEDGQVRVDVYDDGAGEARQLARVVEDGALPGGNGVIGMRERAHVYGGTLEAGPERGGGWRVRASLPAGTEP